MSLISSFYAGKAVEIVQAIRAGAADPPGALTHEQSVSLSSLDRLTIDRLDAALRELAMIRGQRPVGLKGYVADTFDGDGEESWLVRLAPRFARALAALTDEEAAEVSRRLAEKELEEDGAFRARILAQASRPIQSWRDWVALAAMPLVAFRFSRSWAVSAAVGVAFVLLTILVLPAVRRRKLRRRHPSAAAPDDLRPALADLAEFCRRVEREELDLVYEWSL